MTLEVEQKQAGVQACWTCRGAPAVIRSTLHEPLVSTTRVHHCQACRDRWYDETARPVLLGQSRVVMLEFPI